MTLFTFFPPSRRVCVRTMGTVGLTALLCGAGVAQNSLVPTGLSRPAFNKPVAPARPSRMTISFHNSDAADVLRAIAMQSGLSIAVTPAVKGREISVRLKDVTPEEALQLVAEAAGLACRKNGKSYLLGTDEELKKLRGGGTVVTVPLMHLTPAAARSMLEIVAPQVTVTGAEGARQITLSGGAGDVQQARIALEASDTPLPPTAEVLTPKHVSATTLANVIKRAESSVNVNVQDNVTIVTGAPDAVARARALLPSIDTAEAAGQRVEIYRIRYSSADALGAMLANAVPGLSITPSAEPYSPQQGSLGVLSSPLALTSSAAGGGGGGGTEGGAAGAGVGAGGAVLKTSTMKSRQLIIAGPDALVSKALTLLGKIDVAPPQVEIIARIVDIAYTNDLDLGIQWGGSVASAEGAPTFTQGTTLTPYGEGAVGPGLLRFGRFSRTPFDLAAQLKFLETNSRAKTLANPRISTIDNEDASIFIGEVRRFQVLAAQSATAGSAFTVVEIPVGVSLLVRPRVNEGGDITLKVHPSVSSVTTYVGDYPQTSTRQADTTMRMRDGETVVIGGLLRDDEIKSMEQVPLLGNVPLFGELFRRRKNTKVRSEVVLFLTARLLPDSAALSSSLNPADAPVSVTPVAPPTVPNALGTVGSGKGGK